MDDFFSDFRGGTGAGGNTMNIPLLVNGGHLDENPDASYLTGVRLDTGEALTVRLAPLSNRDFTINSSHGDWPPGSMLAIDGAYGDNDHGAGNVRARWINRIAPPDRNGRIRFAMARTIYDRFDQRSAFKSKLQTVGLGVRIEDAESLRAAAIQAVSQAQDLPGWPQILIAMRGPNGQGYAKSWSAATAGEAGHKSIAQADAQAQHFSSEGFVKFAGKVAAHMQEHGTIASVHPASLVSFGKETAKRLDEYYVRLPSDPAERIKFVEQDNTLNAATRYPLDDSGEPRFSPSYLGFQYEGRTLVMVRQMAGGGPYYAAGDLPVMEAVTFQPIVNAELFATGRQTQATAAQQSAPAVYGNAATQSGGPAAAAPPAPANAAALAGYSQAGPGQPAPTQPAIVPQVSAQPVADAPAPQPQTADPAPTEQPAPAESAPQQPQTAAPAPAERPAAPQAALPDDVNALNLDNLPLSSTDIDEQLRLAAATFTNHARASAGPAQQ